MFSTHQFHCVFDEYEQIKQNRKKWVEIPNSAKPSVGDIVIFVKDNWVNSSATSEVFVRRISHVIASSEHFGRAYEIEWDICSLEAADSQSYPF